MKKKWLILALCGVLALGAAGCGGKEKETGKQETEETGGSPVVDEDTEVGGDTSSDEEIPVLDKEDFTLDECVILPDYKKMTLTRNKTEVTDAMVYSTIASYLAGSEFEQCPDGTEVKEGDLTIIAYEGTKDGVAFDGGTSDESMLIIGSHSFIDGFESGMIGMKVNETRDLDLTFPEDYPTADLAGQAVVFKVTVKNIVSLDDAGVAKLTNGEFSSREEYFEYNRQQIQEIYEKQDEYALREQAIGWLQDNTTFLALPKSYIEEAEAEMRAGIEGTAEASGLSLEDYLAQNYYITVDEYEARVKEYGIYGAKITVMLEAAAEAEGITPDGEEYQEMIDTLAAQYGMEPIDFVETYGGVQMEQYILEELITDRLLGYATIKEA